jgi:chemotaxis protein methyltransferase CheR
VFKATGPRADQVKVPQTAAPAGSIDAAELAALGRACGLPLAAFREEHLRKQLRTSLASSGTGSIPGLTERVRTDPKLRERLRAAIANSVTGVRRDPQQFELLERELLPPLLQASGILRVWSAGCSDGSELFDLAGLLDTAGALERAYLLGSDLLPENLDKARRAAESKPPQLSRRLRWDQRDLTACRAPTGTWSLILCRNVTIYMHSDVRDRLHAMLAGALGRDGILMLGRSERVRDPRALGLQRVGPQAYRRQP